MSGKEILEQRKNFKNGFEYGYGSGGYSDADHDGKKEIDCSHLVNKMLTGAGYKIPYETTAALAGSKYFDVIAPTNAKPGDLLLWRTAHQHVGVVESIELDENEIPSGVFFGSQSSTGPASTRFGPEAGYWKQKPDKFLRPKPEYFEGEKQSAQESEAEPKADASRSTPQKSASASNSSKSSAQLILDQRAHYKKGFEYGYGSGGSFDADNDGKNEIDCSHLVNSVLVGAGFKIPYETTAILNGSKYFDVIASEHVIPGDLILWRKAHKHVGIVEDIELDENNIPFGRFFGSQSSTGPASASFGPKAGYWKQKPDKFLRPKFEYYHGSGNAKTCDPVPQPRSAASNAEAQNGGGAAKFAPSRNELLASASRSKEHVNALWATLIEDSPHGTDESSRLPMDSSLFPVGVNLTWHGGIHVQGDMYCPILCMMDGIVVAARLPEKDPVSPPFGSRNFVLIKHLTPKGEEFWSLYMHLHPIQLKDDDSAMSEAMPWLYTLELIAEGAGESNFRPNPSVGATFNPPRQVRRGEQFIVLDECNVGKYHWYHVESKVDNIRGWIAKTDRIKLSRSILELKNLRDGKVVKFNHPIAAGTCIGFMSHPNPGKIPFFHWEIFSEKLASGGWGEIKDNDENDVVCDAEGLKKLINSGTQEAVFLEPLTQELVLAAYQDPSKRAQIIANAYRFKSEWAVDWEDALQRFDKEIAKQEGKKFNLYRFWQDAESADCDLPKGGIIYHYQPSLFKREMLDKPAMKSAKPAHVSNFDGEYEYENKDGGISVEKWMITDDEFLDKDSLTQEQVTKICNGKNPELAKRGFDVGIFRFSQREGINPKVILATLASEQGWCKNGHYDKAFGVGPGGNPQSFGSDGGMPKAVKTYLKHFNVARDILAKYGQLPKMLINHDPKKLKYPESKAVFGSGLADWQREHPKYVEYMEKGIKLQPLNAAMYAKLKYTPWTDFPPQGSHSLATWHKFFRSF